MFTEKLARTNNNVWSAGMWITGMLSGMKV